MKSDWSLVPSPFCFSEPYPWKGIGFKRKDKFIFDHPLKQWPTGKKEEIFTYIYFTYIYILRTFPLIKIWITGERKALFRWKLKGYNLVKKKENSRNKL